MTGWMWMKPKPGRGRWGGGEIKALAGLVESGVNKKRVWAPPGELGREPRPSWNRRDRSWVNRGHTDASHLPLRWPVARRCLIAGFLDQRVVKQDAEARGQWLIGGMVIDGKGAGLGCENKTPGMSPAGQELHCWGNTLMVQKPFFFSDKKQVTVN